MKLGTKIVKTGSMVLASVLTLTLGACGPVRDGQGSGSDAIGQVTLDLGLTPPEAKCVAIIVVPQGGTAVTRTIPVTAENPPVFTLAGLPLGVVTVTEQVFTVACSAIAGQTPAWASDPVTVTLVLGATAQVSFTLHRADMGGRITVSSDFPALRVPVEFVDGIQPSSIVTGPDGALWCTALGSRIDRITTAGVITHFPVVPSGTPTGIAAGPDGNIWFTDVVSDRIGRITPAGAMTFFPLPTPGGAVSRIATGPDGNLWFTEGQANKIGKITTGGIVTEFVIPTASSGPFGITAGPDGNVWFTENNASRIGRITPAGTITEFPTPTIGNSPWGITAGPDGNVWFVEGGDRVGRITPAGSISEFILTSGRLPFSIVGGADGALWFTEFFGNAIGRITTAGIVSEIGVPTPNAQPDGITAGPDGAIWFTERQAGNIGRLAL
jgi:virginiamycin B lyase